MLKKSLSLGSVVVSAGLFWACGISQSPENGAVVVRCESGYAGSQAGIEAGDIIVGWQRGNLGGTIKTPFDLALIELREAPIAPVELTLIRGWQRIRRVPKTGIWRIETRPVLDPRMLSDYRRAEDLVSKIDGIDDGGEALRKIAGELRQTEQISAASWIDLRMAVALVENGREQEANDLLDESSRKLSSDSERAVFREQAGHRFVESNRNVPALDSFREALEIYKGSGKEDPVVAHLLIELCRNNFRECGGMAEEAIAIFREVHSEGLDLANALRTAGTVAYYGSDWDQAEHLYREGLSMVRASAPDNPWISEFLGNIGLVTLKRGDFDTARRQFREAFFEAERIGSPPRQIGYAANFLGLAAKKLGQLEEARLSYGRAYEAFRDFRPGGVEEAGILTNIGNVALKEGNYQSARDFHRRALDLREKIQPGSSDVAASLHNLGTALKKLGLVEEAEERLQQALVIKQRLSPGSGWVSNTLMELAEVARAQGRMEEAENLHRQALEIRSRIAPGHPDVAESLFLLGITRRGTGHLSETEDLWRRAIQIVEKRRSRMDISEEERSRFGGRYFGFSQALAFQLAEQGRVVEAFDLMERARNGALFAMVTNQNRVPSGVPPTLWFEKVRTEGQIRRAESKRARISPTNNPDQLTRVNTLLETLEEDRTILLEKISEVAPRFEPYSKPQSISFSEIGGVIDPHTALLSFTVGENQSMLMTIVLGADGRPSISANFIPFNGEELSERVGIFRALIRRGENGIKIEGALKTQAEKLFEILLGPAGDRLRKINHLLILPDGPLFSLPFGALIDPIAGTYLSQTKTLVFNPSAGVVAGLQRLREVTPGTKPRLVAFGDPLPFSASSFETAPDLGPLPSSAREVETIGRVFGADAKVFLGHDATEASVRSQAPGAGFLHFAVHAVVARRNPLESALFLSQAEGDAVDPRNDGILTASEVMDELSLDGAVVTLSACGTAEGTETPGSGVVGLARAFQLAGARSVVASLWPVGDQPTALLMEAFYRRLHRGERAAEALAGAQRELIDLKGSTAHPFNWAAFQVMGDW